GDVIPGSGGGMVLESAHPGFQAGDLVIGQPGWQEYPTLDAADLKKLPDDLDIPSGLAELGTTGLTAYVGVRNGGKTRAGDMLVISGAAGATGSIVGQIGKIAGCRVIGIAGGPDKCAMLTDELGFDGAIDYKNEKVRHRLRELCPRGIDIMFDNVGGEL